MSVPEVRVQRIQQRRSVEAKMRRPSFHAKIEQWLDLMVLDGLGWQVAAKEAGIKLKSARQILGHPRIAQAMQKRAQMIRTAEGPKNVRLAVHVRDKGLEPGANAATMKVALEAARYIDGTPENGGININGPTVIAGYVINLEGPSEGPRVISGAGATIDHEAMHD